MIEVTDLLKTFELFGVNIVLVAMTAGFVSAVKKIFISAGIKVPTWIWLIIVMAAGFIIALFETTTAAEWIAAGIKNGTAASYSYNVWSKVQERLQIQEKPKEPGA